MEDEIKGYEIRKPGQTAKATITQIETRTAADVFKTNAKNPKQELYTLIGNVEGLETRIATIDKPVSKYLSPRHKLTRFIQRYGQLPKVGMKVDVAADARGYWKLVV